MSVPILVHACACVCSCAHARGCTCTCTCTCSCAHACALCLYPSACLHVCRVWPVRWGRGDRLRGHHRGLFPGHVPGAGAGGAEGASRRGGSGVGLAAPPLPPAPRARVHVSVCACAHLHPPDWVHATFLFARTFVFHARACGAGWVEHVCACARVCAHVGGLRAGSTLRPEFPLPSVTHTLRAEPPPPPPLTPNAQRRFFFSRVCACLWRSACVWPLVVLSARRCPRLQPCWSPTPQR